MYIDGLTKVYVLNRKQTEEEYFKSSPDILSVADESSFSALLLETLVSLNSPGLFLDVFWLPFCAA